jgi:hypothetical protein
LNLRARFPRLARALPALGSAFQALARSQEEAGRPRPDVVVIVADDLGYADVFPDVATPNLERLARASEIVP